MVVIAPGGLAWACNDAGQVVGELGGRAYLWDGDQVIPLTTDYVGEGLCWVLTAAWDINNAGQIVGVGEVTVDGVPESRLFLLDTDGVLDCDDDGALDACELATGTATDVNGNGLPDDCEGLGDLNCDGATDFFDIDPFVLAVIDAEGYVAEHPDCDWNRADCNGDRVVDFFDIDRFVTLITGG